MNKQQISEKSLCHVELPSHGLVKRINRLLNQNSSKMTISDLLNCCDFLGFCNTTITQDSNIPLICGYSEISRLPGKPDVMIERGFSVNDRIYVLLEHGIRSNSIIYTFLMIGGEDSRQEIRAGIDYIFHNGSSLGETNVGLTKDDVLNHQITVTDDILNILELFKTAFAGAKELIKNTRKYAGLMRKLRKESNLYVSGVSFAQNSFAER